MISKSLENEFLKSLNLLSIKQQNKALEYIRALLKASESNNEREALLQFAGAIDANAITEITQAVENGCENIDNNDW
jgi:hypothetical protein